MFWLKNKKNNFLVRTLIRGPGVSWLRNKKINFELSFIIYMNMMIGIQMKETF